MLSNDRITTVKHYMENSDGYGVVSLGWRFRNTLQEHRKRTKVKPILQPP